MIRLEYKKLSIFLFFAIFIVGLFFPSSSSAWMMGLDAAIVWIVKMLTKLWFFGWVSKYFLTMSSGVLGWVTNPQFITDVGGYTQNTLVREGWQIIWDLFIMFFLLIWVVIGCANIYRLM